MTTPGGYTAYDANSYACIRFPPEEPGFMPAVCFGITQRALEGEMRPIDQQVPTQPVPGDAPVPPPPPVIDPSDIPPPIDDPDDKDPAVGPDAPLIA